MAKNIVVYAICSTRPILDDALESLRAAGFRQTDVSVLMSENVGTKDFTHVKATKAPEGAAAGAAIGALIGAVFGWLLGAGMIVISGAGPLLAAGPFVAALAGAGAGGIVGGLIGAISGLAIPEYEAKRYEGRVRKGGSLLSVHCDDTEWAKRAKESLEPTGAEDIAASTEAAADFASSDRPLPRRHAPASEPASAFSKEETVLHDQERQGRL
jgi:hypothetical protein